jgi:transposase
MVFDGADRTSAAETCGMDRQTLRDWVHRYNATGLAGLLLMLEAVHADLVSPSI